MSSPFIGYVVVAVAGMFCLLTILTAFARRSPGVAISLGLAVRVNGTTCYGAHRMDTTLDQTITLVINPTDSTDKPAKVTDIAWTVTPDGVGALTAGADGMSATYVPSVDGAVTFAVAAKSVNGDALTDSVAVNVAARVAVKLGLTATAAP